MFHNDVQTQLTNNNWKRNTNEHPINRILTGYFNTNNQIKTSQSNNYKSETKHIIQRQRVLRSFLNKPDEFEPSIRKPTKFINKSNSLSITSIPSPSLSFIELNDQIINNNNRQSSIKKELDRQSPILIRRHRPTIENLSPTQQVSDITNISGNQLPLSIPPNFTFRNKSSRIFPSDRSSFKINDHISSPCIKTLNYSKTFSEGTTKQNTFNSIKSIHQNNSFPTHIWTPSLTEQGAIHNRTLSSILHSKSHLSRHFLNRYHHHPSQIDKTHMNSKTNYIQDLYISPRTLTNSHNELDMNKKLRQKSLIVDEWKDLKSSHSGISDDDDSISIDGNSSTSTCNSQISTQQSDHTSPSLILLDQHDISSSPNLSIDNSKTSKTQRSILKRGSSRRRAYNLALPPVAEHIDDEETDMKKILEKFSTLQNNVFNEENFELLLDDENSITFQLLNQQETEFEKKLSKLNKKNFQIKK